MATATKERPILFSGSMIRAILDGRKTMTRRVVKWSSPEPGLNLGFSGLSAGHYCTDEPLSGHVLYSRRGDGAWEQRTGRTYCPYGQPGDRLWVRETWALVNSDEDGVDDWEDRGPIPGELPWPAWQVWYREGHPWANGRREDNGFRWRPSIHMPRWASRITLAIAEVRVERLQAITEFDSLAEGVLYMDDRIKQDAARRCAAKDLPGCDLSDYFRELWDSINGRRPGRSWEANPWVWAITFRRLAADAVGS